MALELWQDALANALVGTERKPFKPPVAEGALGELLGGLPTTRPEQSLLSTLATLSLYRRAGQVPAVAPDAGIAPAPVEEQSLVSALSSRHLREIIEKNDERLLREWLATQSRAGLRIPAHLLPALLDLGVPTSRFRPAICASLGERGRWLAKQNPAWEYAVPIENPDVEWQTATRNQRMLFFQALHEADPARALSLLQSTWREEKADDRAAFLSLIGRSLQPADEAILEAALDDRSQSVRNAASDLLARLPMSQFCQRMRSRLRPLLQFTAARRKFLLVNEPAKLEVVTPAECDASMVRDGINSTPPLHLRLGEKAWWLAQMIASTPLDEWRQVTALSPAEIMAASNKLEYRRALVYGWQQAAARQRDVAWTTAILESWQQDGTVDVGALLEVLPIEPRNQWLITTLRRNPNLEDGSDNRALLDAAHFAWSNSLSREVIVHIESHVRRHAGNYPGAFPNFLQ